MQFIRRVRQAIRDIGGIYEMLANFQAWLTIVQWRQDEDAKQTWRERRSNEGTSLWEWLDFVNEHGEIEWRGAEAWGTTGWNWRAEPTSQPPWAGSTSHYWTGFRAGIEHERRLRDALAAT